MSRHKRFDLLLHLAGERDREAARALADRTAAMEEAQAKLQDLMIYRDEYAKALAEGGGPGLGVQVRDYLQFLTRLNKAIAEQQESIDRHRVAVAAATQRWQDTQKQIAVLGKVAERARAADNKDRERRDQKLTDELAGRRDLRGRDDRG
jgi:flagellar FliJ protein